MAQDHWLHGFNYNVEEWDAEGLHYETLAICRQLAFARAMFKVAIEEKPSGRFMIRSRTRVVKRHPKGIGEDLNKWPPVWAGRPAWPKRWCLTVRKEVPPRSSTHQPI
jgi:hypothetical protein